MIYKEHIFYMKKMGASVHCHTNHCRNVRVLWVFGVANVFYEVFKVLLRCSGSFLGGCLHRRKKNAPTSLEHCYAVTMVLCFFYCVMCLVGCRYIVRIL